MSNDLTFPGQSGALANVPKFAQAEEGKGNLLGDLGGASFPRLTFKGNRFRVVVGEEETVLKTTELRVILINAYPTVSRIYFKGTYGEDGADSRPLCASADGEVPLPTVANPPSDKCSICPMNQKGSAISDDGGKRRACSYFKRLALYLPDYPDYGPVVTDAKAMTLFGDSYADKGYFNLRAYADLLSRNRTKPEAVITELSFDENSSVPKVLFRAMAYVDEETYTEVVKPLLDSGATEALVDCTQIRTEGADGAAREDGFRKKLMEHDKPKHAETEEEEDGPGKEQEEEEEEEAPPKKAGKKVAKKKATKKKAVKKKAAKKPEEEKADHPKFCGDCGAKWGTCEHTGATDDDAESEEEEDEADDDEMSEFDADLSDALAEYSDDED